MLFLRRLGGKFREAWMLNLVCVLEAHLNQYKQDVNGSSCLSLAHSCTSCFLLLFLILCLKPKDFCYPYTQTGHHFLPLLYLKKSLFCGQLILDRIDQLKWCQYQEREVPIPLFDQVLSWKGKKRRNTLIDLYNVFFFVIHDS